MVGMQRCPFTSANISVLRWTCGSSCCSRTVSASSGRAATGSPTPRTWTRSSPDRSAETTADNWMRAPRRAPWHTLWERDRSPRPLHRARCLDAMAVSKDAGWDYILPAERPVVSAEAQLNTNQSALRCGWTQNGVRCYIEPVMYRLPSCQPRFCILTWNRVPPN